MLPKAIAFANDAHIGQTRKVTNLPYIVHPMAVATLVKSHLPQDCSKTETLMTCALLHDVVEDCNVKIDEIKDKFGETVARIVQELTSDPEEIKKMGKTEYLKYKMLRMSDDALFIKLCDRFDNLCDCPPQYYTHQTLEILSHLRQNRVLTRSHLRIIKMLHNILK